MFGVHHRRSHPRLLCKEQIAMAYKIIATDDTEGTVTYAIDYGTGSLNEQLRVADYPTKGEILARIAEREQQITDEVSSRKVKSVVVPSAIKAMIQPVTIVELHE